jgi:hypothetical protein
MRLTLGAFLYDPNAHVRVMSSQARKPRNIVLLSDGTGNSSAKLMKTNVWRMYEAVDLTKGDQLALYDNGVGTSSFKPLAILGGALGWGLKRNVRTLYMFACANYQPGDRIFAFGFSRGAFTIRVLMGLIADQGLITTAKGGDTTGPEKLTQGWFAGVHSNVGGGYPDDSLAHVSLRWMADEARSKGLVLHPHATGEWAGGCSPPRGSFRWSGSGINWPMTVQAIRAGPGGATAGLSPRGASRQVLGRSSTATGDGNARARPAIVFRSTISPRAIMARSSAREKARASISSSSSACAAASPSRGSRRSAARKKCISSSQ